MTTFSEIVRDLVREATSSQAKGYEITGVQGATRPPSDLPAVRIKVTDVSDAWVSGIEGSTVRADVVVYTGESDRLDFRPDDLTRPGAVRVLNSRRLREHASGDVLAMERDGGGKSWTLPDGSTATVHKLILRGVWEALPEIDNPGQRVHLLASTLTGAASGTVSGRGSSSHKVPKTQASATATVTSIDAPAGTITVDARVSCYAVGGADSAAVVRALDHASEAVVGRVVPTLGRCRAAQVVSAESVHSPAGSGIERVTRFTFAFKPQPEHDVS